MVEGHAADHLTKDDSLLRDAFHLNFFFPPSNLHHDQNLSTMASQRKSVLTKGSSIQFTT